MKTLIEAYDAVYNKKTINEIRSNSPFPDYDDGDDEYSDEGSHLDVARLDNDYLSPLHHEILSDNLDEEKVKEIVQSLYDYVFSGVPQSKSPEAPKVGGKHDDRWKVKFDNEEGDSELPPDVSSN